MICMNCDEGDDAFLGLSIGARIRHRGCFEMFQTVTFISRSIKDIF